ncbi:hypothetical protein BDZ89DRAFT_1014165 [Hymenopellis radicata]|nr:hypothetical protein BDZ89DRAFT_1014165 [Hymenopellis radicata]
MGYTLPSPDSPREQIRALTAEKESIESQLEAQISILKANNATMQSPLVDPDGFPRADIDIYAVRGARVRVIELRNDLGGVMSKIGTALERVYDPAVVAQMEGPPSEEGEQRPFAKVNGVAPGSPAAEAGLQREDLIVKFGSVVQGSLLQSVAELVGANENRSITIKVLREDKVVFLTLVPKKWGGRGMLGCHIVPYP